MTTGEGKCIDDVSEINAIGHRVVHGGEKFKASCLITDEVINTLRELSPLAPLHNPAGILGIEAARKVFGNIPMVAVFDTAFHSTMPPKLICTPSPTSTMRSTVSAVTASTAPATSMLHTRLPSTWRSPLSA